VNTPLTPTDLIRCQSSATRCHSRAHPRQARGSFRLRNLAFCLLLAASWSLGGSAAAEPVSKAQMQSLDEQVQEIKSDVLSIATELKGLEEKLLYPSNTHVAVFVSLAENSTFQLDSVQVEIDGQPAARHIYSFKELEALQKGGVQRIYTGNISTGEHQLDVFVAGKLSGGKEIGATESFSIRKDVEPKLVAITLAGQDSGDAFIQIGGW
jgi:hypothetical protein